MKKILFLWLILVSSTGFAQPAAVRSNARTRAVAGPVWSVARAQTWYRTHPWISGTNFIPSTAINQLEMWQAATFDPTTIDRELGWAEGIGFNTMRVFLHSVAWKEDPAGFKKRVGDYLVLADKHHIQTIFVFFDDCWNKVPHAGLQPAPRAGVHNSGWVQDPGEPTSRDSAAFSLLKPYVHDVLTTFRSDPRILFWDLYNEPGNSDKRTASLPLVRNVFAWAREVNPTQPLTSGIWTWDFTALNALQIGNSDIVTYHDYEDEAWHLRVIQMLRITGRPLVCTEYMARPRNSRFSTIMPLLKRENVGAISWGLVEGKTNTKYAWDTPLADGSEPVEWFHEVFRHDGTPYRRDEAELIKKLNGR
jgi:hypothetical protein